MEKKLGEKHFYWPAADAIAAGVTTTLYSCRVSKKMSHGSVKSFSEHTLCSRRWKNSAIHSYIHKLWAQIVYFIEDRSVSRHMVNDEIFDKKEY